MFPSGQGHIDFCMQYLSSLPAYRNISYSRPKRHGEHISKLDTANDSDDSNDKWDLYHDGRVDDILALIKIIISETSI